MVDAAGYTAENWACCTPALVEETGFEFEYGGLGAHEEVWELPPALEMEIGWLQ